jgi:hypothetical protein
VLGQTIGIQGVPSCRKLEVEYYRPDQRSGAGAGALPLPEVLMAVSCAYGRKNKTSERWLCLSFALVGGLGSDLCRNTSRAPYFKIGRLKSTS